MSAWNHGFVATAPSRPHIPRRMNTMKKIMSIMLGLTLVMGAVSFAFAQDKKEDTTKKETKKGKKKEDKKEETK